MFPWADGGNLREFWARENSRERSPELILWCFRQMLGLIGALKALHDENCRHGDLKPENILHFKERNGEGILVIADVGVSRLHRDETSIRDTPTSTKATTPSYEAPEAQPNQQTPRSRRYDMWSMGCIFLEFAIWLLYNIEAINNFRKARRSRDDPKNTHANFYTRTSEGTTEIHSAVSEAMDTLREDPRCKGGTALEDLVKLVAEDLLRVEVSHRARAGELYNKLGKIVQVAEKNPSYLLNRVNPPPAIPLVFRPMDPKQSNSEAGQGLQFTTSVEENTNGVLFATNADN